LPTYKVTAPDGRTVRLTGDSPPTEQELEEVFAALPAKAGTAAPAAPAERSNMDVMASSVKGLGKSAYNAVAGLNKLFAGPDLQGGPIGVAPPTPELLPVAPDEQTAYTVGNVAQFMAPGGPVKGAAGMLAQGGKSAAIAAAQGETPRGAALAGGFGAAGPLVASLGAKLGPALKEGAQRQMARVLGPTTKENKAITERVVPELLDRGFKGATRKSLHAQATFNLTKTGKALEVALDAVPKGTTVNTGPIVKHLDDAKQAFVVNGVEIDPTAVRRLDGLKETITQLGADVDYKSLRRVRQIYDQIVADARGFHGKTVAEGSTLDAQRELANAIRRELAKATPDVAKVNKEYSFWANVEKVLGDTLERTRSQSKPLGEQLIRGAAVAGGLGGAASGTAGTAVPLAMVTASLNKLIRTPAWNTWSAVKKHQLAAHIASGRFDEAATLMGQGAAATTARD
jgi:hypothetical protein